MVRPALIPVIAVLLAACGTVDASRPPPATVLGDDAAADCIATPESAASIAEGLTVQGGGTLRDAYAVALAPGLDLRFVVAAEIDGPGMEGDGEIGTWAVGELGGGPIFAVNAIAQEFSEWEPAANVGSPWDFARDAIWATSEASAAEECASGGG